MHARTILIALTPALLTGVLFAQEEKKPPPVKNDQVNRLKPDGGLGNGRGAGEGAKKVGASGKEGTGKRAVAPGSVGAPAALENVVVRPSEFPSIVAVVGDASISRKELDQEYTRLREEYRVRYQIRVEPLDSLSVVKDALDGLVQHQLLLQAARRLVGDRDLQEIISEDKVLEEIDQRVADLKKAGYRQFTDRDSYFAGQVQQFGLTREKVIEGTRERILVNHYLWQEVFRVMARFVRPSESRAYYRSHIGEFTKPLGYSYRRIEFGQGAESNAKAKEISAVLAEDGDFLQLAKKYSEEFGGGSKQNGRLWTKSYEEVQEMAFPLPQIITRMKAGETSGPYRIQNKVVFVLLEGIEEGEPMPYEKAQALIERKLLGLQREARTQELIRRLQRQTRIESYVVGIRLDGELLRDSASESEAATGKSATADPGKKGEVSAAPGGESKS